MFFLRLWLSIRGLQDGYLFPGYRRNESGRQNGTQDITMETVPGERLKYPNFRDLLKDSLFRLGCANAPFIGTHSLGRGSTQLFLLLGVSLYSVRQRGFWATYQRMDTYMASNNRRELVGDLLPAPTLLTYASFSVVGIDAIDASLSR